MSSIVASASSKRQLEARAELVRMLFGISKDEYYLPIVEFIELQMPRFDEDFEFQVVSEGAMEEYAHYDLTQNKMVIREDVYNRAIKSNGRDRFTLAHELGHYFCLKMGGLSFARLDPNRRVPAFCNPEWHANQFASYFLMPRRLIRGMSVEEVSLKCGVSKLAAKIALLD